MIHCQLISYSCVCDVWSMCMCCICQIALLAPLTFNIISCFQTPCKSGTVWNHQKFSPHFKLFAVYIQPNCNRPSTPYHLFTNLCMTLNFFVFLLLVNILLGDINTPTCILFISPFMNNDSFHSIFPGQLNYLGLWYIHFQNHIPSCLT